MQRVNLFLAQLLASPSTREHALGDLAERDLLASPRATAEILTLLLRQEFAALARPTTWLWCLGVGLCLIQIIFITRSFLDFDAVRLRASLEWDYRIRWATAPCEVFALAYAFRHRRSPVGFLAILAFATSIPFLLPRFGPSRPADALTSAMLLLTMLIFPTMLGLLKSLRPHSLIWLVLLCIPVLNFLIQRYDNGFAWHNSLLLTPIYYWPFALNLYNSTRHQEPTLA